MLRISCKKCFLSTSKRLNSSIRIGGKIESPEQLHEFFKSTTWSTQSLLEKESIDVTDEMLEKLVNLSGFTKKSLIEDKSLYQKSLSDQLNFIAKLKKIEVGNPENNSDFITRLVDDKHIPDYTYNSLNEEIKNLKPQLSKGEIEGSWNPLSLSKLHEGDYFIVKEGLHKSDK